MPPDDDPRGELDRDALEAMIVTGAQELDRPEWRTSRPTVADLVAVVNIQKAEIRTLREAILSGTTTAEGMEALVRKHLLEQVQSIEEILSDLHQVTVRIRPEPPAFGHPDAYPALEFNYEADD